MNRHLYPVPLLFSRLPYKEVQLATAVVIGERNYFGLLFAICTFANFWAARKVYYWRCGNGEL